jgi:hypothetical protein
MTDLVMQSIDSLSLMDFKPMPIDELKVRCHHLITEVEYFYWWRWSKGLEALDNEHMLPMMTENEILRLIVVMIRQDEFVPGTFERCCRNGVLRAVFVELAIREQAA